MLTIDQVRASVREIRKVAESGDNEVAHSKEDELHQSVLDAIAKGECENPQECARIAIKTLGFKFHRWMA